MESHVESNDSLASHESRGLEPTSHIDREVMFAAQTGTAVLISGRRDAATAIARRVHDQRPVRSALVVLDCGQDEATLLPQLTEALSAPPSSGRTLLLRDVDRLTRPQQWLVASRLECNAPDAQPWAGVQVIASTSVALFQRVIEGAFDEKLFYRLNTIHILVPW
jgi:hypothetical protein